MASKVSDKETLYFGAIIMAVMQFPTTYALLLCCKMPQIDRGTIAWIVGCIVLEIVLGFWILRYLHKSIKEGK